ncbi:hypothetical protein PG989_006679 [Apiospora arundinis]
MPSLPPVRSLPPPAVRPLPPSSGTKSAILASPAAARPVPSWLPLKRYDLCPLQRLDLCHLQRYDLCPLKRFDLCHLQQFNLTEGPDPSHILWGPVQPLDTPREGPDHSRILWGPVQPLDTPREGPDPSRILWGPVHFHPIQPRRLNIGAARPMPERPDTSQISRESATSIRINL